MTRTEMSQFLDMDVRIDTNIIKDIVSVSEVRKYTKL